MTREDKETVRKFGIECPDKKIFCKDCGKPYGKHYGPSCPDGHGGFKSEPKGIPMKIRIAKESNDITFTPEQMIEHISELISDKHSERFINTINETAVILWEKRLKIKTIKFICTMFPLGLKEAKEYCESNFNEDN